MRKLLYGLLALVLSIGVAFSANNFVVQQPNGQWAIIRSNDDGTGAQQTVFNLAPNALLTGGVVPLATGAPAASLVLKAGAGNFYGGTATNTTATAGFCLVIDSASAPGSGSAVTPLLFAILPANGQCSIMSPGGTIPAAFSSAGITFLVSSNASPYTFTSGVITAAITGMVK